MVQKGGGLGAQKVLLIRNLWFSEGVRQREGCVPKKLRFSKGGKVQRNLRTKEKTENFA